MCAAVHSSAFFLASPNGQRFCLYHRPQAGPLRGSVLYIHPLAEEMNRSRRMAALQSRALASAGYGVLQLDLLGCGDSSGDFGDAHWEAWLADVVHACAWLRGHAPGPLWLWGLRAACLLALQAAPRLEAPCHFLFWQPAWSGRTVLQQFLRLRLAGALLGSRATPDAAATLTQLRARLQQGQSVEVAGYTLASALAQGLERAVLAAPAPDPQRRRIEWFELSSLPQPRPSPMPEALRAAWCHPALQLVRHALPGVAFWHSAEVQEVPDLLSATTAALCAPAP